MKAKDLREKSLEDLKELEKSAARAIFETRFKNFTNRLDDTSAIRKNKRELARIKTLLGERARGVATPAAAPEAAPVKKTKAAPKAAKTATEAKKPAAKKTTAKKGEAK
jgi:large subunit ribosomal protein L29